MRKYDEVQALLKELRECSSDEAYLSRQAADEITRLTAENERLREDALKHTYITFRTSPTVTYYVEALILPLPKENPND